MAADILGLVGFVLILIQSGCELDRRRRMEAAQHRVERMADNPGSAAGNAGEAAQEVLEVVKAQAERYRPWQGWFFFGGALCLALSYVLRIWSVL